MTDYRDRLSEILDTNQSEAWPRQLPSEVVVRLAAIHIAATANGTNQPQSIDMDGAGGVFIEWPNRVQTEVRDDGIIVRAQFDDNNKIVRSEVFDALVGEWQLYSGVVS